ncbi:MAG TPA: flagellar hook-associated protein FlgL [Firmicutes bacterium]|jgi:flagellar hook-associated protein 3 FlgL|nr:flagellar hook-associated protein FlgL [Bacillota bacterium]
MRITHRMIAGSASLNLQQTLARLDQRAQQAYTGKAFRRPSQDPVGINRVMRYREAISRSSRFKLNIGEAKGWLQATETALREGLSALQQIEELTIYGANGGLSQAELDAIAEEVHEFYEHLVGVGNTEYNGLYIFGGYCTGSAPYGWDEGTLRYYGDAGERRLEISMHQEVVMNLHGERAFGGTKIMDAVTGVHRALLEGDREALSGLALAGISEGIDLLLDRLSEVGARYTRVSAMEHTLSGEELHLKEMLSLVEDKDFAEAMAEFSMEEYAYRAALATSSRVLQPNLLDYLR